MELYLPPSWQKCVESFYNRESHPKIGGWPLRGGNSGNRGIYTGRHSGVKYCTTSTKTPHFALRNAERNNASRSSPQRDFGKGLLPCIVADAENGETILEKCSRIVSLLFYRELDNTQKSGWKEMVSRTISDWYNRNSNIYSAAGYATSSTPSPSIMSLASTTASSVLTTNKKRGSKDKDDSPDENGRGSKKTKKQTLESETSLKLACPFWKKDPRKYNIYVHRVCASSAWESISRVKEHLYRCHLAPPYCSRCKEEFENDGELMEHLMIRVPCSFKSGGSPDGISFETKKALKNRKSTNSNQPLSERWKELYRILFPGLDVPEPWFGPVLELIDVSDFEAYCRQELPKVVQSQLEAELGNTPTDCNDTFVSETVKRVQDCHNLLLSNYRSQLASGSAIGDSTNITIRARGNASPDDNSGLTQSTISSIAAPDFVESRYRALDWPSTDGIVQTNPNFDFRYPWESTAIEEESHEWQMELFEPDSVDLEIMNIQNLLE